MSAKIQNSRNASGFPARWRCRQAAGIQFCSDQGGSINQDLKFKIHILFHVKVTVRPLIPRIELWCFHHQNHYAHYQSIRQKRFSVSQQLYDFLLFRNTLNCFPFNVQ